MTQHVPMSSDLYPAGRKRAEKDLQRVNRALRLLSACSRAVIKAVDEKQLLSEICRQIVDVGGYRMCWVGYPVQEATKCVLPIVCVTAAENHPNDFNLVWDESDSGQGMVATAMRTGLTQVQRDLPGQEIVRKHGLKAGMALPLDVGAGEDAVLSIFSTESHAFGKEEVSLLEELASNLAFGISSLRERAERRRAELELQISEQKYRTLAENSPSMIMRYDRECRRTYVNRIYTKEVLAPIDDVLWVVPGSGWRASTPVDEYLAVLRQVMSSKESAQLLLEWPRLVDGQLVSLSVHMVPECDLDGKVTGVLAFGHDVTALKQTERQLQESLSLLQNLMTQREIALEAERKHIAQEIHDELGQYLTSLRMGISSLRYQYSRQMPDLAERIQALIELTDKTIQVVRDVACTLRPSVIDAGIVSALEWQLANFSRHTGIDSHISIEECDMHLSDMRATALFRIVQESLTNVARHATADRVSVVLRRQSDDYVVEVHDDGCGFDSTSQPWTSLGMIGMRERALMLGGELIVNSTPGQGTVIRIRIPAHEKGGGP